MPVACREAVPHRAQGKGHAAEGPGPSLATDDVQNVAHGGFSLCGPLGGPEDHGSFVFRKVSCLAKALCGFSMEGSEHDDLFLGPFPLEDAPHCTMAERTLTIKKKKGASGSNIRSHRHHSYRLPRLGSFPCHVRVVQAQACQMTMLRSRTRSDFDA